MPFTRGFKIVIRKSLASQNSNHGAFRVKCLLVDDLEENLVALRALLEDENVELYSVRSGVDALELMLQHNFGLALVDVQMPGMDGFELAELMRGSERTRQTPIIFLTAGAWNRERIFKGYESGAVDFMFKPIEPRILRSKVRVFIELNRQKLQIAKAEERYALSTSAAQIGTWELNIESNELVCSDIKLRLFGLEQKRAPLSRNDIFDRIHPDDRPAFEAELQKTIAFGMPFNHQFRVILPSGHVHWLDTKAKASFDERGKVSSVFGIDMDISTEKMASHTLQRAKEEADAANVLKSEFLANMSHEIRTPMTAILGFSELLLNEKLSEQARLDFAARIHSNGDHLLHLIDDILDLSKFEAGRVPTEKIDFALEEIICDALRSVHPLAARKGLELKFETRGAVPKVINSDPHRLRQIILNLVSNSIKFTTTGFVHVIARHSEGMLAIDVEDTGIGLNAEQSSRLFQAFQQADSSVTRKFGGTGLGLALSKRIAEALGGTLTLSSSIPKKGSVFTVRIKANANASQGLIETTEVFAAAAPSLTQETLSPTANPKIEPVHEKVLDGVSILLVEDSVDSEALMRLYLEAAGATIEAAHNGQEAIDLATASAFNVILMDVQMPGMDGLEATRRLRSQGYSTPIIALTAHALPKEVEKSIAAGCDQHVTKPISRVALIQAIQRALSSIDETVRPSQAGTARTQLH
jgi:signal transduction histidine kinase/DNA-binding response OmpR family regulator